MRKCFQTCISQISPLNVPMLLRFSFRNLIYIKNHWWEHPLANAPSNMLQHSRGPHFFLGGRSFLANGRAQCSQRSMPILVFARPFYRNLVLVLPLGWPELLRAALQSVSLLPKSFPFLFQCQTCIALQSLSIQSCSLPPITLTVFFPKWFHLWCLLLGGPELTPVPLMFCS